eukprot:gene8299-202_t
MLFTTDGTTQTKVDFQLVGVAAVDTATLRRAMMEALGTPPQQSGSLRQQVGAVGDLEDRCTHVDCEQQCREGFCNPWNGRDNQLSSSSNSQFGPSCDLNICASCALTPGRCSACYDSALPDPSTGMCPPPDSCEEGWCPDDVVYVLIFAGSLLFCSIILGCFAAVFRMAMKKKQARSLEAEQELLGGKSPSPKKGGKKEKGSKSSKGKKGGKKSGKTKGKK